MTIKRVLSALNQNPSYYDEKDNIETWRDVIHGLDPRRSGWLGMNTCMLFVSGFMLFTVIYLKYKGV
jgi:hypothetical protein